MGGKKRWQEIDAHLVGLAVLMALANAERGFTGEVDLDLGGRWVTIVTPSRRGFVLVFEVEAPPELHGHWEVKG